MTSNLLTTESRNLDFLRASAVLLVLVDHLFMAAGLAERHPVVWDMGRLGVLMFFVHTSLVLMFSLERSELKNKGGNLFRDFYVRRGFRIYPLSIVFVLLAWIFAMPETPGGVAAPIGASQLVANLALVQNIAGRKNVISPLWSLPLEIQMYVVLPFLYILAKRYGAKAILKVAAVAALIGLPYDWLTSAHPVRGLDRLNIIYFVPCFLGGIMCYCLSKKRTLGLNPWLWPVAVAAVIMTYLLWTTLLPNPTNHYPAYRAWIVCWMLGVLIPQFREMRVGWLRAASHHVAKYSYGIYLGQVCALWIGFTFWPHLATPYRWIASIVLLAAIAVISFARGGKPWNCLGKARRPPLGPEESAGRSRLILLVSNRLRLRTMASTIERAAFTQARVQKHS